MDKIKISIRDGIELFVDQTILDDYEYINDNDIVIYTRNGIFEFINTNEIER